MSAAEPADGLLSAGEAPLEAEIDVHDASRFEWRVAVPVPESGRLEYSVEAEFELPSGSVSARSPWDQLEGFTRLDRPQAAAPSGGAETAESVRQRVLSFQQMLKRAREGVGRHCRLVFSPESRAKDEEAARFLTNWLDAAITALATARAQLAALPEDAAEVRRERALADEFASVRLLDFLAEARAATDASLRPAAEEDDRFAPLLEAVDGRLAKSLDAELNYRRGKGYLIADADSPASLERYVERGGLLKKHFEAALFLDRESYRIDDRLHIWFTAPAAILAGAFAFALQLYIMNTSNARNPSWSLVGLFLLMGGTYAIRERVKEIARAWLTGRVYRFYAQRVVRGRLPAERAPQRPLVMEAREWCNETVSARPDPVDPESGAARRATLVDHVHRGFIEARPELAAAGARRIRQIFRYDLSPLFPRLQDPVKRVPVLDAATGRSRFVDAPRRYQIPIEVVLKAGGERREVRASIVVDKQGIVRVEAGSDVNLETLVPRR